MEAAGPDTTDCAGPLITANESSSPSSGTTSHSGSGTASMAPDGRLSSNLPRPTTSWTACGQGEDAGDAGRGERPQAVAHDRGGRHAPTHPEARQRVLHDEDCRLTDAHPANQDGCLLGGRGVAARRVEHAAQVEPEVGRGEFAGPVDLLAERGLRLVQLSAHAHVLPTLAREHEDDRALAGLALGGDHPAGLRRAQRLHRVLGASRRPGSGGGDAPSCPPGASTPRPPGAAPGGCGGARRAARWPPRAPGAFGPTAPADDAARTGRCNAAAAPRGSRGRWCRRSRTRSPPPAAGSRPASTRSAWC